MSAPVIELYLHSTIVTEKVLINLKQVDLQAIIFLFEISLIILQIPLNILEGFVVCICYKPVFRNCVIKDFGHVPDCVLRVYQTV